MAVESRHNCGRSNEDHELERRTDIVRKGRMNRTSSSVMSIFPLVAILAISSAAFGQTGAVARRARPKSNLPFDPHDLSGVWSRTGGDRGMSSRPGINVPPMTPEGQKLFDASGPGYGPRAVPPATSVFSQTCRIHSVAKPIDPILPVASGFAGSLDRRAPASDRPGYVEVVRIFRGKEIGR